MTILRTQPLIADASMTDLLETYNAMMGEDVKRFASRAVAERRVAMAMLSAEDRTAHAGVPKGECVEPKTAAELSSVCKCMAETLCSCATYSAPEPDHPKATNKPRAKFTSVRVTNAGTSKVQPASARAAVLRFVADTPNGAATLEVLDAAFPDPIRGHIQKLLAANHLEAF